MIVKLLIFFFIFKYMKIAMGHDKDISTKKKKKQDFTKLLSDGNRILEITKIFNRTCTKNN